MKTGIAAIGVSLILLTTSHAFSEPLDTWHWRNPLPQGNAFSKVDFGNGTFMAVAYRMTRQSAILTSSDGIAWKEQAPLPCGSISGLAHGNGVFVAIGNSGAIFSSSDGARNGLFVAVGDLGLILTSPDGIMWTKQTSGARVQLQTVAFGGGTFVATGQDAVLLSSVDGATWKRHKAGTLNTLHAIAFGRRTFVAAGRTGTILQSDPL